MGLTKENSRIAAVDGSMLRILVTLLAFLGVANAFFSSFSGSAVTQRATRTSSTVTMARNPLKAYKIRKRRLKQHEADNVRISVFRSNEHIYAQVIDDAAQTTLCSASSTKLEGGGANMAQAFTVGKTLAEAMKEKGIENVYFDRQSENHKYLYHGRVASLIDGVREGGIDL